MFWDMRSLCLLEVIQLEVEVGWRWCYQGERELEAGSGGGQVRSEDSHHTDARQTITKYYQYQHYQHSNTTNTANTIETYIYQNKYIWFISIETFKSISCSFSLICKNLIVSFSNPSVTSIWSELKPFKPSPRISLEIYFISFYFYFRIFPLSLPPFYKWLDEWMNECADIFQTIII